MIKKNTIISITLMVMCVYFANFHTASAAEQRPADPVIVEDSWMKAGVWTTWDLVEFGSYPQTEITTDDGELYDTLNSLDDSAWDENRNTVIDGVRYHRIMKENAYHIPDMTNSTIAANPNWYDWGEDETAWHYFQWEPIKWRVLDVEGDTAFLFADMVLDVRTYHDEKEEVAWETSTLRSWLNGYDASANALSSDYTQDNFIDRAFTESQQTSIMTSHVENINHLVYEYYTIQGQTDVSKDEISESDVPGGNDTQDKLYLLSESEVYATDTAAAYGFSRFAKVDEGRWGYPTDFAIAMGTIRDDNYNGELCTQWWLRSPGSSENKADMINYNANLNYKGQSVNGVYRGVRPVLHLDLNSKEWTYEGTFESDEIYNRINLSEADIKINTKSTYTYTGKSLKPSVTVTHNGQTLQEGIHYELSYSNNVNPGKGYITVAGIQKAKGSQTVSFVISKASQKITTGASVYKKAYGNKAFSLNAKSKTSKKYTSSNKKVATVSSSGKVTIKGTGIATITIKASESSKYKATTKKVTIKVAPKKVTGLSLKSYSKKKMTVRWNKDSRASGYKIVYAKNKSFTKSKKTITVTSYKTAKKTISKLSSTRYYVKVCAYKKTSSGKLYGNYSVVRNVKVK